MAASIYRYVTLIALGAAIGGFLFGGDTSTMNGAITGITTTLELTPAQVGFVAAVALLGCAAGAWFAGPIASRIGRTPVMGIAAVLIAAGSLGAAFSGSVILLGLMRVVTGLGIGALSAVVPGYIAEIAPTRIRGRLGSMWQFALVLGQLAGLLWCWALASMAGGEAAPLGGTIAWRWMFIVVAVGAAVYFLVTRGLPRSPHDLLRHGKDGEARALLARVDPRESVDSRVAAIQKAQAGAKTTPTLSDLKGSALGLKPIVWTGIGLAVFQQLLGISVVKTYSNTLWQTFGFGTDASFGISIFTIGVSVGATIIAISIIDKVSRRRMLGMGAIVSALALALLSWAFSTAVQTPEGLVLDQSTGIVALVAINLFALAFGITWGPVMWVMLSELFDSDLRVTAVAVATALNWTFNWVITRTFPLLAAEGLALAYGIYTVFAVLAAVFVWKVLPETKDRVLS